MNNITPSIEKKIGKNLHNSVNHPVSIIKQKIYDYLKTIGEFKQFDEIPPMVHVVDNFDKLLMPKIIYPEGRQILTT